MHSETDSEGHELPDNVVSYEEFEKFLSGFNQPAKKQKPKKEKTKAAAMDEMVMKIALDEGDHLPSFGQRWICTADIKGNRKFYAVDEDLVCRQVSTQWMEAAVARYQNDLYKLMGEAYLFDCTGITKIVKSVCSYLPVHHDIEFFAEKSDRKLCYTKLDFDIDHTGTLADCPTFAEFLSRTDQPTAIAAWFGSLFFKEANISQYLWIYGGGGNGKSSISNIFQRIFAEGSASLAPPTMQDRFWAHGVMGKRLVVFADCNHYQFVTSELFKKLTGGDPIIVEEKFEKAYNYRPMAKYLILSNQTPNISSQRSDLRRSIFSEIRELTTEPMPHHQYNALLWAEAPKFIGYCMKIYNQLCPGHGSIPLDDRKIVEDLAQENEIGFKNIFDEWFVIDNFSKVSAAKMDLIVVQAKIYNPHEKRRFKEFVSRISGGKKRFMDGIYYMGIRAKTTHEHYEWQNANEIVRPSEGPGYMPRTNFPEE